MTYAHFRNGFESIRMPAGGATPDFYAPGAATGIVAPATLLLRPGTVDIIIVERPDTTLGVNADLIQLFDIPDLNLMPAAGVQGSPVLELRPWGVATDGSYHIEVHRRFRFGIAVRMTDITWTRGAENSDSVIVYGSIGRTSTGFPL